MAQDDTSVKILPSIAKVGLNLDSSTRDIGQGELSFSMNGVLDGFDGESVNYSNEPANQLCTTLPEGYKVIGRLNIIEDDLLVFWLLNPTTNDCEIGTVSNCIYEKKINAKCLGFDINNPILKIVYFKDNCSLPIFWVDGKNKTRWIDLLNLPFKQTVEGCDVNIFDEIDCNRLNVQPDFFIPTIAIKSINSGGNTKAGTYQFAVQYANALKEAYTSFYSVTNPISLFDTSKITQDFNYPVDKNITITISDLDRTGLYDYINVAVVRTVNNISTVELVGNYPITGESIDVTYSGEIVQQLNPDDIFQKFEIYDTANDLTTVNDVLVQDQLTTQERISYQEIASKIHLQWETWRIKGEGAYKHPLNTFNFKGYMRGETYPFELVPLLTNGKQCDGFIISNRLSLPSDLEHVSNDDTEGEVIPKWKVYDTASISAFHPTYTGKDDYEGPYQYGEFAYNESTEHYPCNDIYGSLQNTPLRFHKFPENSLLPHFDKHGYIYPMGVKIDVQQVVNLIKNSTLTAEQKSKIQGFKIVRGNRAGSKSIVAKGILNNVLKYTTNDAVANGSASTGNPLTESVNELIDSAINNIDATIGTLSFLRGGAKDDLRNAIDQLTAAKTLDVRSIDFQNHVNTALDIVKDVRSRSNLDSKTEAYLDVDISLIGAIIDVSNSISPDEDIPEISVDSTMYYFPNYLFNDVSGNDSLLDNIIYDDSAKSRFAFHSPDTHFYQPSLGDKLRIEGVLSGVASGHIVQVKNHSRYQFVNIQAYLTALLGGLSVGFLSGSYGVTVSIFNGTAAFTAYQAMLDIIYKVTPHRNYAYQFNSIGNYTEFVPVTKENNIQRTMDLGYYLIPGIFNVGDDHIVNNYQRESSVYIKTDKALPFTQDVRPDLDDHSKLVVPTFEQLPSSIASYYGAIKNSIPNQYGQLYSYQTIDTGYQKLINLDTITYTTETIFGGDIYINKFAFKNKLPLFSDNRVAVKGSNPIDDADISYREIPNIGKPKYWFSTDVSEAKGILNTIFGVKQHNFFWEQPTFFYDNGKIFLFAYGIPQFYVESEVNVDVRQAFNDREGDFVPHTSNFIPDEWLQEYNVSINNDNSYYYNKTFSKQNIENSFSHLPTDFVANTCTQIYPFRAIFSEKRTDNPNPSKRNNWLIYKPANRFDFPQNFGSLVSLDGINDSQVLARFENKSLIYNALLTAPTSAAQVYLGQSLFSQQVPPLDIANTDLGYVGSQHKFLYKTEFGPISIDAKRGQIFIINGRTVEELSSKKYKCSQFLTQNLSFSILNQFPNINIDNNYNGIGLHGVYDARFGRMIFTKLDYECIDPSITYSNGIFYKGSSQVSTSDITYFKNKSFTMSFDFDNMRWISFHTYTPPYYIGNANTFYQGQENKLYIHNTTYTKFNNFNNKLSEYTIEYPLTFKYRDELLQSVQDYTSVRKYNDYQEFIETDDVYFDESILFNNQQCSGVRKLSPRPTGINSYLKYPIYNTDNINITFTKSNNFYQYNTFWSVIKDKKQPIWKSSSSSPFKELNQSNMNYKKLSYQKAPIIAKDLKIRHTLNTTDEYKLISQFITSETQESYK